MKKSITKINPKEYYLSYSGGKDSHFLYWFIKEYLKRNQEINMKVEIKTNEKGYCDCFIINGQRLEKNITKVTIVIEGGYKPQFIIEGTAELDFQGENVEVIDNCKNEIGVV